MERKQSIGARKRGPYIQRGSACVNCRRRKMKCDGIHPVCGPCAHSGHSEDCEFTSSISHLSQSQILEQNIATLEARLKELQQAERTESPTFHLRDPYMTCEVVDEKITSLFMSKQHQLGFFLTSRRSPGPQFFKIISLNGLEVHPSNTLTSVIRLWGMRLSGEPCATEQEQELVTKALKAASTSVSDSHPYGILHGIQADILLANYFLSDMRLMEGKYHILTALSMILATGIQANSQSLAVGSSLAYAGGHYDADGFWSVLVMDQCWASVFNGAPNMNITAIPMEQGKVLDIVKNLKSFLNNPSNPFISRSTKEYAARASVTLGRIMDTRRTWNLDTSLSAMNNQELLMILSFLERMVQALKGTLPPLNGTGGTPYDHFSLLGHLVFYVCAIKLYSITASRVATSKQKLLHSAEMIIKLVTSQGNQSSTLDPIVVMIWKEAVHAILDEMVAILRVADDGRSSFIYCKSEEELKSIYRLSLTASLNFSVLSRFQLQKVQERFTSM